MDVLSLVNVGSFHGVVLVVSLFVEVCSCDVEVLGSTSAGIYLQCGGEVTLCRFDRYVPDNSI